jgi:16S rRNA (guanine(966)-N(2))-methyltransferase RsmD
VSPILISHPRTTLFAGEEKVVRVISGKAKGHRLKMVPGDKTRPITDRVKENLFNILGDWVIGTRWLDLFAGTGQVGIEALSRGAASAIFVDNSRPAVRTIQANLAHTRLSRKAEVLYFDAFSYLTRGHHHGPFDVIYIAPPQYQGIWSKMLNYIDQFSEPKLADDGLIIIQIDPKEYEELKLVNFNLSDQRRYGNTLLGFFENT